MKDNISNCILFRPTDVDGLVSRMKNYQLRFERREDFIRMFARKKINKRMAESILAVLKNQKA